MQSEFNLTRKQREIFKFLLNNQDAQLDPPTLEEICQALGLKSRGSLHKHIQGLIDAGLVEAPNRKQRGVRLTESALRQGRKKEKEAGELPFIGAIAAGKPIEAIEDIAYMTIPEQLKSDRPCYVLQVKGDSMIDDGIFDGDWVVIEQRSHARNGEIVVALIDKTEATLKYIEQYPHETVLIPANKQMAPMRYRPEQVEIQGVLVGQMRSYLH
ncbi:MAG: transcriptional repressor LexA [Gammaproteobacteria bacterium]